MTEYFCPVPRPAARIRDTLCLAALLFGLASPVPGLAASPPATTIEGTVTHVTDGDSLWLTTVPAGASVELRLQDIDAPEICQAWGPEAKRALQDLVLKKQVSVRTSGHDSYGRTLGTLYLDTLNVNKALVQEGHAWSTRYKFDRGTYVADERMAKALSRGLNRDGGAVMPKDFRRSNGPCASAEALPRGASAAHPVATTAATAVPVAMTAQAASYRCDGRTHCAQMRSCDEATYFLKNCPGVKMDGDRDGVPCETQWCKR